MIKMIKDWQENSLKLVARSYLRTAIDFYIKIEGKISVWDEDRFGFSAIVVCSLNRAIEHFLKLHLYKIDKSLLYPIPKNLEEYCQAKGIEVKNVNATQKRIIERFSSSRTISFKEAIKRIKLTSDVEFDFGCFEEIHALRNCLEHHWDRNEQFFKKIMGKMSSKIIPCLKEFIIGILGERVEDFIDTGLTNELAKLDKAIKEGHTLKLQKRLDEHKKLYLMGPEVCRKKSNLPDKYRELPEEETASKCPVCGELFFARWDWEADFDIANGEGFIGGGFPDVKCLFCYNCHFYVEGEDVEKYLPEGLDIEDIEFEPLDYEY